MHYIYRIRIKAPYEALLSCCACGLQSHPRLLRPRPCPHHVSVKSPLQLQEEQYCPSLKLLEPAKVNKPNYQFYNLISTYILAPSFQNTFCYSSSLKTKIIFIKFFVTIILNSQSTKSLTIPQFLDFFQTILCFYLVTYPNLEVSMFTYFGKSVISVSNS